MIIIDISLKVKFSLTELLESTNQAYCFHGDSSAVQRSPRFP